MLSVAVLNRYRRFGAAGYSFTNAEAEAYVAEFASEPSDDWKAAFDDLVSDLKAAGIYTKTDYFNIQANVDSEAATHDLINPTLVATLVNSPTFTAKSGFAGNGTSSYVSHPFTPSIDFVNASQDSCCIALYVDGGTNSASASRINGSIGTAGRLNIIPWAFNAGSNEVSGAVNANSNAQAGNVSTAYGLTTINRSASNASQVYRNGASLGTSSVASTGLSDRNLFTGAMNSAGTPGNFHDHRIGLFAIFSSLDSTEQAALDTAWDSYLAAIASL